MSWWNSGRTVELACLAILKSQAEIKREMRLLRDDNTRQLHELHHLREEIKKLHAAEWAMKFNKEYREAVAGLLKQKEHRPPPAPKPRSQGWWDFYGT